MRQELQSNGESGRKSVPTEEAIKKFWENAPVGDKIVGGLFEAFGGDYARFFDAYDKWLYTSQGHILRALDKFDWQGKRVLEIGLGQGSDSEQLIRRGAIWSGIDLTFESVERVRKRLEIRNLPCDELHVGSALNLPFDNRAFDVVYAHGVLHHIPDIGVAQREIWRVLKPAGRLVMMVYARNSLNYQIAIRLLRRGGLILIYALPVPVSGIYAEHKRLAKEVGLLRYLKLSNFIHRSTDGPHNPYSKVYDGQQIRRDFSNFEIAQIFKLWMHAPPLSLDWLPGGSVFGWHLWAELKPKRSW
jgi:SAM-dependent methyltransferase